MTGAAHAHRPEAGCPKWMTHGPCGGVQPDGRCEVGGPCAFVHGVDQAGRPAGWLPLASAELVEAPRSRSAVALGEGGQKLRSLMDERPLVVVDLPSPGPDVEHERRLAAIVAGQVDAVLLGDSPWARVQLPPSLRASVVAGEGVRPWAGVNCRDRNRVALEAELAGLAGAGIPAVHCVTGDHPSLGHRPDAQPVFDLDSTQLAALAAQTGMLVSVAETPGAPPLDLRPARAASKAVAGAHVCFVNLVGELSAIESFVAEARALAPQLRFIACVPMVISTAGAERIAAFFPGSVLPDAVLAPLTARDPIASALAATLLTCADALAIDGVRGVNISCVAGPGEADAVASALARVGAELGAGD
jgi:methylenetetrahydrofolate reductase (NADPH)